ncbi:MAG: DNA-directed DNA polymerase [Candidatus Saccharibacteria bacterium GW2011_GWA2_46_10]|nr:MAG: DNA-directed DNA polymerase [Candidatus Saccharibacteria bacterium GW2011_GWA2_46_10]
MQLAVPDGRVTMRSLELPINRANPEVMHIDLNSCFATVEQQARPLLRGKPIGVTNRLTKNACVVAASYEAKAKGVKVGMTFSDAKLLAPDLIMLETDPPKYHYVYQILVDIMRSYSPNIVMKSIDEGIINFEGTSMINQRPLEEIGYEIKHRLKKEVGCWMTCNIGIATNRFLAKTAASLHKPDGLDVIDHRNLRPVLSKLELTDLSGIAERNQARLNACGIYTPLQFLDAPVDLLRRQVFKSICGKDWYKRLRGWEVDDWQSSIKIVGRQYVLDDMKPSDELLRSRLAYLCETTAMKLRYKGLCARGIYIYLVYDSGDSWYERRMFKSTFFSNGEVHRRATLLFNRRPHHDWVRLIAVSCYKLAPSNMNQVSLLEEVNREVWLTQAMDEINHQYGEFTITYASSLDAKSTVKQKIPFGSTRYFELLLNRA